MDDPHSYRPPMAPSAPTLPHSETVESPSSMKSAPISTIPTETPQQASGKPPEGRPGWGWNDPEKVNWAAENFSSEKFAEFYQHRAADVLRFEDELSETAVKLLKNL